MTQSEYQARREQLLEQLSAEQSVSGPAGTIINRPVRDVQLAIQALDAEWQRQQSPSAKPRFGRLYIVGEGK
jgi:hypothetical protein